MTKRLFISIPFPKLWLDLFEHYSHSEGRYSHPEGRRPEGSPSIRWIPKENLHLTLYFIGETPEEKIPEIRKKLGEISAEISPFPLEFSKIDFAPPGKSKRMIWAYFLPSKNFENLVQKIQETLRSHSGECFQGHSEERRSRDEESRREPLPHATLARFKDYRSLRDFRLDCHLEAEGREISSEKLKMADKIFQVMSFELQKSELSCSGAEYEVIESFRLKGLS